MSAAVADVNVDAVVAVAVAGAGLDDTVGCCCSGWSGPVWSGPVRSGAGRAGPGPPDTMSERRYGVVAWRSRACHG